jgi:hypothetical protein
MEECVFDQILVNSYEIFVFQGQNKKEDLFRQPFVSQSKCSLWSTLISRFLSCHGA